MQTLEAAKPREPDYRRVWDCILLLNETQRFAFSDVHVRPIQGGAVLYTADLPPIPFKKDDSLRAIFILDYLSPPTCKPIKVAETVVTGGALEAALASAGAASTMVTVPAKPENSEYHFCRRDAPNANWLLHCAPAPAPRRRAHTIRRHSGQDQGERQLPPPRCGMKL